MTADIIDMGPRDPIFHLAPELRLRLSGALVVSSREVSRVFGRRHHRVLRKIMEEIWHAPMRPDREAIFRMRADGIVDITSEGLVCVLSGSWRSKRARKFISDWVDLLCEMARKHEARTGTNPLRDGLQKFFPRPSPALLHPRRSAGLRRLPAPRAGGADAAR